MIKGILKIVFKEFRTDFLILIAFYNNLYVTLFHLKNSLLSELFSAKCEKISYKIT